MRRRPAAGKQHAIALSAGLFLVTLAGMRDGPSVGLAANPRNPERTYAASFGDLRFDAAAVAYRHGEREARAEFTIRIPYRQIRFLPEKDRYGAKLRLTVEMWNTSGRRAGFLEREAILQSTDAAATSDSLLGEVYSLGLAAAPGTYTWRVRVEDMNAPRQGLVYKMRKQKRQGEVKGSVDMGPWLLRQPSLSGLQFAWEIREGVEGSAFAKGPYEVMPNPGAHYGHFQDAISVYYELYDAPPPPGGRIWLVSAQILASAGDTLFSSVDSLRVTEGTAWPHALSIDVSSFAAGHYRLILGIIEPDGRTLAQSQSEFDVLWSMDSWLPDAVDLYEVTATTLLQADSLAMFRELSMGDKERWIEQIWRRADPTPETADNERRNEFRRRVAFVNANYSIYERGMYSDRGRVYIRYGEPDDIKIERIPVGKETLGFALGTDIPPSSKAGITDTQSGVADSRAYEIWTYDMRGRELVPRFGMNELTSALKFVFVDEQGYGEYTLKYSSTSGIH